MVKRHKQRKAQGSDPGSDAFKWGVPAAWSWGLLLFLVQVAAWPGLEQPGRAARAMLMPLVFALIASMFLLSRRRLALPVGVLVLVVIPLLAGLAGILSAPGPERYSCLIDGLLLAAPWLAALALASVGSAWPWTARTIDRALGWGAALALVLVSSIGLAEAWFGLQLYPVVRPPAGPYLNRNVAAQALVLLIPLALAAAVVARKRTTLWLAVCGAGLGLAFLMATRSRGGWIAALLGWGLAAAIGVLARRKKWSGLLQRVWRPGLALLALGAAGALVPVGGADPLPSVGRAIELVVEGQGSNEIRKALWSNTAAMAKDAPWVGVGPGRFPVIYPLYHSRVRATPDFGLGRQPEHAHGDLLEYAAELGVPAALCLALLLLVAVARSGGVAWRQSGEAGAWALARVAALSAVFAHGLVSFPLHSLATVLPAFLLVGRGWESAGPVIRGKGPWPARVGLLRGSLAIGVCLLSLGLVVPEFAAQRMLGAALESHREGRGEEAAALAEGAAERSRHRRNRSLAAVVLYSSSKQAERSLRLLEPALEANPHHLNLLLDTGARRLKSGRAADAEQAFRHALEISPELGRAWLGLAMSLDARGARLEAAQACRQAVALARIPEARQFCDGNGYTSP